MRLHQGATDIGQGANTVITQICADALGLPVSAFELSGPDTAPHARLRQDLGLAPDLRDRQGGAAAGPRAQGADPRAQQYGARDAQITLDGEHAQGQRRAHRAAHRAFGIAAGRERLRLGAEESYDPPTTPLDENGQGAPYAVYGYGAQIAEVAVDTASAPCASPG